MNVLTFDVETTHVEKRGGGYSPLPYFGNRLVSIGYKWLNSAVDYDCYYHSTEPPSPTAFDNFQRALNFADVLIGHNIKFDLTWIKECGFTYEGHIYDTMVAEYILARARRWPLGLAALAEKYDVTRKEKDLVEPYLKAGKTFYDIPWEIIEEYGRADVLATEEIALKQLDAYGVTFEEMFDEPRTDTQAVVGDDRHAFAD
jgi:DNA polymerase I-like protein with 3'-5' exonuclease and polymerase domains